MNVLASRGQLRASFIRWSLFTVPAVMLLGYLSGQLSGSAAENPWFDALTKPATFPPPATFGIVWTILYAMMGFALALICTAWGAKGRKIAIVLFVVQLAVNLLWSPMFFAWHEISGALILLIVLDILVIATIIAFWRVRRLAAYLMLPYLAWILFATLLNYQFLQANPEADGAASPAAVQRMEL